MKILVTGASGFIGSFLVQKLLNSGHTVTAIDNFNDYYSTELKKKRIHTLFESTNQCKVQELDINDKEGIESIFQLGNFDLVIHLAAQAGVRLPAEKYIDSNIAGFLNIFDCINRYGVRNFVFASSSSVYGNSMSLPYREDNRDLSPTSFYGLTKKMNEDFVEIEFTKWEAKIRALRFFTVYGPWGRPDMAYFRLLTSALRDQEFVLFGNGEIQRDFTYISDVVDVIVRLAMELVSRSEQRYFDRVNIGGDRPLSMNNLISEIESQSGKKIKLRKASENSADSKKTAASKDYLTSLIGQHNYISLEEGIAMTLDWAKHSGVSDYLTKWVESSKK